MTDPGKHLSDWLRDAHAMEMQALKMMEAQVSRLESYPELRGRIEQHIEETRRQANRLETCMKRQGIDTSAIKDTAGKMTAMFQGLSGAVVEDEVVKGHLASYVFEHFEIASYRVLIAAADEVGDIETRNICEENLREEEQMAAWLAGRLPATAQTYLRRELEGAEAKR